MGSRRIVLTERCLEALRSLLDEAKEMVEEYPCDHSVGICCCARIRDIEVLEAMITVKA